MSAPARVRLFAALELPDAALAALAAFRDAVADPASWRPVATESLHVTLVFMGWRDAGAVEPAAAALRAAVAPGGTAGAAPVLAPDGALLLPPRRPRVLCAALADRGGALGAVQSRVAAGLVAAGLAAPEARPFRPHVTVARLRPGARAPRAVEGAPEPAAFAARAVTLFASQPHPSGARYTALARVPFAPDS